MTIRLLDPKSELAYYRKLRIFSLETDKDSFHLKFSDAVAMPDSFFQSEIDSPLGCLGAFKGVDLVGMVTIKREDDSAYLYSLYVLPTYRGLGLGTKLLQTAERLSKSDGVKFLRLTVMKDNPATELYLQNDFSIKEDIFLNPGEILLEKELV